MANTKLDVGFAQGYAAACSALIFLHDQPGMAKDVLREHFKGIYDLKKYQIDEFDANILRPILKEIQIDHRKHMKKVTELANAAPFRDEIQGGESEDDLKQGEYEYHQRC